MCRENISFNNSNNSGKLGRFSHQVYGMSSFEEKAYEFCGEEKALIKTKVEEIIELKEEEKSKMLTPLIPLEDIELLKELLCSKELIAA